VFRDNEAVEFRATSELFATVALERDVCELKLGLI
jgi:hypothetical protein